MEWKDITLKTYNELYKITSNVYNSEEDKRLKSAALLNGITYEELLEQPITATTEMVASTVFLYDKPKAEKIKKEYVLNGRSYVPFKDFSEITTSQYIDYQAIIVENFEEHLMDLMYIILVPKGHVYNDGYDTEQAMDDIGSLKVTEALGIADFFLKKYRRLLRRTLLYSKAEMRLTVMRAPKELKAELREREKELARGADELLSMCGSLSLRRLLK